MIKTMLGETCGMCTIDKGEERFKSYLIEGDCGRFWISEKEFKRIKLPFLGAKDQKMYDEIKQAENGNKIKMVGDVIYDYEYDDDHCFTPEEVYRAIEAIVKGGYN